MHNLTKTLAAMSLLAPMAAHSLGVGDIKLHSVLNQKLNAEIALSLSTGEELADVKISLASPDKFDQAGITWSSFLSKVKFEPILKANGQVVVKVTSHEVVQEPFLDFLLEVSWPKGEIFKEFTVLVDPPATYQQSAIDAPTISASQPTVSTVNTDTVVENDFSGLAVEGEYGPTSRSDSLWGVAEKVNTDKEISVEQMMMALYKANPRAFYKKNVNALMAGKNLKIPDKSEIMQLSTKQASTEFHNQMAVWEGKAVVQPKVQQVATTEIKSSNQLTLVPPTQELIGSEALSANATDVESLSLKTENQQLQERLANLEKQFVIMQEMLAIKDQQLAAIQNAQISPESQVEKQDHVTVTDASVTDRPLVTENSAIENQVTESTVTSEGNGAKQVRKQESLPVASKPPVTAPVVSIADQEESTGFNYYYLGFGILGGLALVGVSLILWRRRQAEDKERIDHSSMFASSSEIILPDVESEFSVPMFDETPSYDVGTVGESSFLSEFTPSDFDVFESDQAEVDPSSEADVYLAYGRYQQAEELIRQAINDFPDREDYKLKLLEIFYASENSQAFEEFSTTLVAEGKNSDLKFWTKVVEMGSELVPDSDLFSAEKGESKFDAIDGNDFDSEDELPDIREQEDLVIATKEQVTVPLSDEKEAFDHSDIDFDLSSFSLMDDTDKQGQPGKTENKALNSNVESIEFNIDSSSVGDAHESATTNTFADDIESIDFDLSSFNTISSDTKKAPELSIPEDFETFDFNRDTADSSESLVLDDDMNDINLDDFDFSSDHAPSGNSVGKIEKLTDTVDDIESLDISSDNKSESNDFDFDFDFDDISSGSSDNASVEEPSIFSEDSLIVSDLTDMDEFETKIDLAKAYIDMGDVDAAKDIAQEVLEKGTTEAQRQEAQAIIDKLK
ncbi:MAG: fimbrial protein FimV [Methylococcaceae bacterium]|nr:fimbrial protein FimV [Methylococcaceae bacterium]